MHRVKFFSVNDLSGGHHLSTAETIMKNFDSSKDSYNINEIIEFYNISEYINAGVYLKSWSTEDVDNYKTIVKSYGCIIGKFFNNISNDNFILLFNMIDAVYRSDFWRLFEKYNGYEKVSSCVFRDFFRQSNVMLYDILKCRRVVNCYGAVIRGQLLSDEFSAELLLNKYEVKNNYKQEEIFLPNELSIDDEEEIIINYINSSNPNLNYLRIIVNVQSSNEFRVTNRTRLNAKKRVEDEEAKIFEKNSGIRMGTSVAFSWSQEEEIIKKTDTRCWDFSYSSKWIQDNSDYNTLMNNFIYLFDFVDLQMRVALVNKPYEMVFLEQHFMHSKKAYTKGIIFEQKNHLSKLQMAGYYHELNRIGIRLEEVIEWFFKSYVLEEFDISEFKVKMPSKHSLYFEKCRMILPEMESALKQFCLFVQDGTIDQELLQMSSDHLIYKNVPSLINKKYIYGNGDEFEQVTYYLFSDQCILSYVERIEKRYENFFDLIRCENVCIDDYHDFQSDINWLIEYNYIKINAEGYIKPCIIEHLLILEELYYNEVLNYWRYPLKWRNEIDEMWERGIIKFENSLFSKPEYDYINYFFNKASFNNALDLRNMYSHGTQPSGDEEDIHKENYMVFLRLFILIIIKINDELCISSGNKQHQI